jgi:peroxiredoxin
MLADAVSSSYERLPAGLPVPVDDGAADHLPGLRVPALRLASTAGEVDLGALGEGRTVLYLYPRTGRPGEPLPTGWDAIPGARGCTPETCSFRDHHQDLLAAGAARVLGLSAQSLTDQAEAAERLRLPYPLVSDPELRLARLLELPTFTVDGMRLYRRLTLVVRDGVVDHAFHPVFPPDAHAGEVLEWLHGHPIGG